MKIYRYLDPPLNALRELAKLGIRVSVPSDRLIGVYAYSPLETHKAEAYLASDRNFVLVDSESPVYADLKAWAATVPKALHYPVGPSWGLEEAYVRTNGVIALQSLKAQDKPVPDLRQTPEEREMAEFFQKQRNGGPQK